ncbi:MAG: winged helix-turn-helix domain-containing protein [Candidatus Helarchaeota archaeon]
MNLVNLKDRHILIRITKIDQFIRFFSFIKEFSANKFKKLYQKGKELGKFFSDTKKILILSRFTIKDTLSFTELQQWLGVSSSLLSYDLKKMTELGFLKKVYREERDNKKFSFYTLTTLGEKVVSQIFSLYPKEI